MRTQKNYPEQLNLSDFSDKSLLILDDDDPLRGRLSRAMEKKGFIIKEAKTVSEGLQIVKNSAPSFALVDLRLEDGNGLDVVKELSKNRKDCRIVMLTGYGNLPTAVAAIKAGAIDYMAKPVDADDVEAALLDDMNTPRAIAAMHRLTEQSIAGNNEAASSLKAAGQIMGLLKSSAESWFHEEGRNDGLSPESIEELIEQRRKARMAKDFPTSDQIRDDLFAQGIVLEDGATGTTWRRGG